MQTVTTTRSRYAKPVFQAHGIDAAGQVIIRRQLKRRCMLAFFESHPPNGLARRGPRPRAAAC